jgi:transcriptional regulator with PAS, ATPase and Fis domain
MSGSHTAVAPASATVPFPDCLDCMAVTTDFHGCVLHANRQLTKQLGPAASNFTHIQQLVPSERKAPCRRPEILEGLEIAGESVIAVRMLLPEDSSEGFLYVFLAPRACVHEKALDKAREDVELTKTILDLSVEGLQVVNTDGIITYVNRSFEEIHNIPASEAVGRHVTQVIENTRMHVVAKTGVPEIDDIQKIGDRHFFVSRIPLRYKGKLVGAVGKLVFQNLDEVDRLGRKLQTLRRQLEFYKTQARLPSDTRFTFHDVVAISPSAQAVKETAMRVAPTDTTVLLLGESGVGKEVYAHAIHATSLRSRGPFIRVNCSAIQESLFESELFGYEEGAFTGAKKGGKQGKFELANFGTIFLDEIADMPLEVQSKLLRVLQEQEIDKLGGEKQKHIDVRVLAATNQDLEALVAQGKFRKDLFYRINVIPLRIPPLRERREDIPQLVRVFWEELKKKHGIYYKGVGHDAMTFMESYEWPGNIRELHNVLERSLTIVQEDTIDADHMRMIMMGVRSSPGECTLEERCNLQEVVESAERRAISFALAHCNNNRARAAKLLGVSRALVYKKMHEYGLA